MPERERPMSYRSVLGRTVTRIELPFGYTLTIWSAGSIASFRFGLPRGTEILLFALGAIAAYLLCAGISLHRYREALPMRRSTIAIVNVFGVVAAVVVALSVDLLNNSVAGFAVAGFVGTFVYIISISAFLYLASLMER